MLGTMPQNALTKKHIKTENKHINTGTLRKERNWQKPYCICKLKKHLIIKNWWSIILSIFFGTIVFFATLANCLFILHGGLLCDGLLQSAIPWVENVSALFSMFSSI